jgi:hypothetical protein
MSDEKITIDPQRVAEGEYYRTGILIRAWNGEKWVTADIAQIDKRSLYVWLRSEGGNNRLAENTVAIFLGHEHFEAEEVKKPQRRTTQEGWITLGAWLGAHPECEVRDLIADVMSDLDELS